MAAPKYGILPSPHGTFTHAATITNSDTVNFPTPANSIIIQSGGTTVLVMEDGTTVAITTFDGGQQQFYLRFIRVNATTTDTSGSIALW